MTPRYNGGEEALIWVGGGGTPRIHPTRHQQSLLCQAKMKGQSVNY